MEEPTKWYKHVSKLQQVLNSTYQRSINTTPFELLIGSRMKTKDDLTMKEAIEQEIVSYYDDTRRQLRDDARKQIEKVHQENRKRYNLRRRDPNKYHVNDLVAIRRTQMGPGLKLRAKYLGPYRITKVKPHDTYDVIKTADCEGPLKTTTCAEYTMKRWPGHNPDDSTSSEADDDAGRPNVGK